MPRLYYNAGADKQNEQKDFSFCETEKTLATDFH